MVNSSSAEEAGKALFAVSALIRNNIAGQDKFYAAHGYIMLQVSTPTSCQVLFIISLIQKKPITFLRSVGCDAQWELGYQTETESCILSG